MSNTQEIDHILAKATQVYGLNYYALFLHPFEDPVVIHSYPNAWVDIYLSNQYHKCDQAHSSQYLPVLWDTEYMPERQDKTRELFERAADFNINAGYTMPILFDNELAYLTFSCGGSPTRARQNISRQRILYQSFANTLSLISCLQPKVVNPQNEALCVHLAKQEKELHEENNRILIGHSALLSASLACKTLPSELSRDIESLIESAYSNFK